MNASTDNPITHGADAEAVVITGAGVVSPIGHDRQTVLERIRSASSDRLAQCGGQDVWLGALEDWEPTELDRPTRKQMCPAAQYALVSTQAALREAQLDPRQVERTRMAVFVGSMMGGLQEVARTYELVEARKKSRAGGMGTTKFMNSASAVGIATTLGAQGPAVSISSGPASGLDNIGAGYELIRSGLADVAICGATEEDCHEVLGPFVRCWEQSPARGTEELEPVRPFDARRTGTVLSAGCGIVVLESSSHAARRSVLPLAEIGGYCATFAAEPGTDEFEAALQKAISTAVADAESHGDRIGHVICGACGLRRADLAYARAITHVLGTRATVSSLRGELGFPLGAGSALDAAMSVWSLSERCVPGTPGWEVVDPECGALAIQRQAAHSLTMDWLVCAGGCGYGSALILRSARP